MAEQRLARWGSTFRREGDAVAQGLGGLLAGRCSRVQLLAPVRPARHSEPSGAWGSFPSHMGAWTAFLTLDFGSDPVDGRFSLSFSPFFASQIN